MRELAVVILAGGKSQRMGCNKALLPYKGSCLMDEMKSLGEVISNGHVFVSAAKSSLDYGPATIVDEYDGIGPVGGMISCIKKLAVDYQKILFIPVDLPLFAAEAWKLLLEGMKKNNSDVCFFEQSPLPCLWYLSEHALTRVHHMNLEINANPHGSYSVGYFLEKFNLVRIQLPEVLKPTLTNTNTPEEWDLVVRGWGALDLNQLDKA